MNIIKHKTQRVAVFIDAQNMYHSARSLFGGRVNFKELLKTAVSGRQLIRAFGYVIRTKTGEEKPFIDALLKLGIETREKDLQEFFGGAKKADWDVGLSMDAIKLSPRVDVVVLVSGDGDYVPMLEYLQNHGLQMEVIAFGESSSRTLIETADDFIDLSKDKKRFLMKIR